MTFLQTPEYFKTKNVMHINKGSLEIQNLRCDNEISKHTHFSNSLVLWNNTAFESQNRDTIQYTTSCQVNIYVSSFVQQILR